MSNQPPTQPSEDDVLVEAAQRIMWAIERHDRFNAGTADGRWHSMPKESRDRCLAAARAAMMLAKVPAGVLVDVAAERRRQIEVEGWTPEHDDTHHAQAEMAVAAACYILNGAGSPHPAPANARPTWWPWSIRWWKPKSRRRDLIRALALLVAEVERLDRAAGEGR